MDRFSDKVLPIEQSQKYLVKLLQSYLSTMVDLGVETWLAHGSLLGWWWNRKVRKSPLLVSRANWLTMSFSEDHALG